MFLYVIILFFLSPKLVHAYLDPGTGSYLLQIIAAVFFTGLFMFKHWQKKIKELLRKLIFRKDKKTLEKDSDKKK